MSESFRRYLRALPDLPEGLPDFGAAAAHACSPATVGDDAQPSSRMPVEIEFRQARHDRRHVCHRNVPGP